MKMMMNIFDRLDEENPKGDICGIGFVCCGITELSEFSANCQF